MCTRARISTAPSTACKKPSGHTAPESPKPSSEIWNPIGTSAPQHAEGHHATRRHTDLYSLFVFHHHHILKPQSCKIFRTIDVHDIFGFDPARGELPMTRKSCCNNCTFQNGASSRRCRLCGWVLRSRPQYEDLTDAIVWGFVFGQLGLSVLPQVRREKDVVETIDPIKLTREVLKVYAKVYPYLPISRLGLDLYKQQCYCITHLLLALSSYGQLKLPKSLFASELKFIREEMSQVMKLKDPELVGEFVDCLLIFGDARFTNPKLKMIRAMIPLF